MEGISLIFPHQLTINKEGLHSGRPIFLVEEFLFFLHFSFHKHKLVFHRATMKSFAQKLQDEGFEVRYIEATQEESDVRILLKMLAEDHIKSVHIFDPVDDWLSKRINQTATKYGLDISLYPSSLFLDSLDIYQEYFKDRSGYFQTDFYTWQRKRKQYLLDQDKKPMGGKWSFDKENRKKIPKNHSLPKITMPEESAYYHEAIEYVEKHFPENPGQLPSDLRYPIDELQSRDWLEQFFYNRFHHFGDYEDAILQEEHFLYHSVLTPLLNVDLIQPDEVIANMLNVARNNDILSIMWKDF